MKQTLSIYFGTDRTYLTVVEPKSTGLELVYINSTQGAIDLENIDDESSLLAAQELEVYLSELHGDIGRIAVTLPSDSVLVTHIPGKKDLSQEDIVKLVNLEIRQNYPQFNFDDFTPSVIPLAPRLDGKEMLLAVIIPRKEYTSCKELLSTLKVPITSIEISQMSAHNALLYNYPEEKDKTAAVLNIGKQFVDISVITKGQPIYYNLASFQDKNKIGDLCEDEFSKILSEYVEFIDSAYFFGSELTLDLLNKANETIMGLVMESKRLNAFRMMSCNLDNRTNEYCIRTAHIYPPCIGACIPSYHDKTKLF